MRHTILWKITPEFLQQDQRLARLIFPEINYRQQHFGVWSIIASMLDYALQVRAELFRLTGEARKLSAASLAVDANDARALFALYLASGMETDYTLLVEKKYFRSYKLSKESQQYARKLLLMKPPVYDAYVSHGMLEYVMGNLNFFFRWFVHFDQIQGNKQLAIDGLGSLSLRVELEGSVNRFWSADQEWLLGRGSVFRFRHFGASIGTQGYYVNIAKFPVFQPERVLVP